jgi:uncharacterized membrane protein
MSGDRLLRGLGWAAVWVLIVVILVFLVIRVGNDVEALSTGVVPGEGDFDRRYALNPTLAYAHILPGAVYLLGAPFQLSRKIRRWSLRFHRSLGRVVLTAGLITGLFAIAVGLIMPFGGLAETSATVVFGLYFLVALGLAYRAIRRGEVAKHRRWMVRAFAIGAGVGLIRIIVGIFEGTGAMEFSDAFGLSFWLAFSIMSAAAEIWLRIRPRPRVFEMAAG